MIERLYTRDEDYATRVMEMTTRGLSLRAASVDEGTRSVEAVLSTDNPVRVFDWRRYEPIDEVLVTSGAQLPSRIVMLDAHFRWSNDSVVGSIREIRVEGNQIVGRLYFAEGPKDSPEERIWQKVRQGHITDVSVGYRVDDYVDIPPGTTQTVGGRTYTARKLTLRVSTNWTPREGSVVPIGADEFAKIRSELGLANANAPNRERSMNPELRRYLESIGLRGDATEAEAQSFYRALGGDARTRADELAGDQRSQGQTATQAQQPTGQAAQRTESPQPPPAFQGQRGQGAPPVAAPAAPMTQGAERQGDGAELMTRTQPQQQQAPQPNEAELRRQAAEAERERINYIQSLRGDDVPEDLLTRAINEGWDEPRVNSEVLQRIRSGRPETVQHAPNQISRSHERDCTERALAAGFMHRVGLGNRIVPPNATDAQRSELERLAEQGERYRGYTMAEMCRESLRISRREVPHDREEMIRAAVSTPTLANAFTTSVNARLLMSFEEAPDTTQGWVHEEDVADFKQNDRIALGKQAGLQKLPRGDTAKHATFEDNAESYKIARYAKQFVVDEQDIIDENIGIFQKVPAEMGAAARRLRPDLVYAILLANADMRDSVALFHSSSHGANLITDVLNAAGLKAGAIVMGKQTEDGVNLNLMPRFLVVPQDLMFTARELVRSTQILIAGDTDQERGNINTIADLDLQIRVDNRIGAAGVTDPATGTAHTGSATNWFLASEPMRTIEVGYLSGSGRRPQMRRFVLDRGQWGIGWDIKMDIGGKSLDWRGLVKSTGAGG